MTAGLSGSYGINGTDFTTQPTEHNWLERGAVDYALDGHIVYVGIRQYQFRWDTLSPSDYNQLLGFYNLVGSTGTVVVDLPQHNASDYRFYSYSGCTLQEPYYGGFFSEHIKDVTMIVEGIRT
jgi:hypothetical protein